MNESISRQREIGEKLETESSNLNSLKDSLNKCSHLTENMVHILTSFESRLKKLEGTIVPVHQETMSLQIMQENIDKTLKALDHVISYHRVARTVEQTVRNGPSGYIDRYLESMAKIQEAIDFFVENTPGSPELATVKKLFSSGRDSLELEFSNLLSRYSKQVPPITILDMVGSEEVIATGKDIPILVEHLPEKTIDELAQIGKWSIGPGKSTDFINVYHQVRSNTLLKSIESLKDHLQKKSAGMSGGSILSPAPGSGKVKQATPGRRATLRKIAGLRKGSAALVGGKMSTWDPGKRMSLQHELKEESQEIDSDTFITLVTALVKLMQSEAKLMEPIIPEEHQRSIFNLLIQPALDLVILLDGESIVTIMKKCVAKHDYSVVLSVLPILKHLRQIEREYNDTLQGTGQVTREKLPSLISHLEAAGEKALEEFFETIRSDPDKQSHMPKDGTVHELTSNAIVFLENFLDYTDIVGRMLAAHKGSPETAMLPEAPIKLDQENNRKRLAIYVTKVLGSLGLNLDQKAKTYADQFLGAIFLLNNYHYILKSLQRSGLIKLVEISNPEVEKYYDEVILVQKRNYSKSWSRVITYLVDDSKPSTLSLPETGKLKDKERQQIKDKFKGFNTEIEEIAKIQRNYAIPDIDLQMGIVKDNKEFIQPYYNTFLKKYENIPFTRNPDKYIKYTVESVRELIETFFDASA